LPDARTHSRIVGGIGLYGAIAAYMIFALFPDLLDAEDFGHAGAAALFRRHHIVARRRRRSRISSRCWRPPISHAISSTASRFRVDAAFVTYRTLAGYAMSRFTFLAAGDTGDPASAYPDLPAGDGHSAHLTASWDSSASSTACSGLIIIYTASTPPSPPSDASFFDGIPKDLEEAAMIDGCTRAQAMRKVIVPLTLPGMGATLGFVSHAAWSELLSR